MQKGHPTQHSLNNTNNDNIHNFNNNYYNNNNDNNDNRNNNLIQKLIIINYLKQKTIYNHKSNEVVACKNGSRNVF